MSYRAGLDLTEAIKNSPHGIKAEESAGTVLLAGGVGITPAISMLRHMYAKERHRKVLLFWGINTASELAFQKELTQMRQAMKNFVFIPVVLNDPTWAGEKGFIDRAKIETALKNYGLQLESSGFYICGPVNMMKVMVGNLKTMGVKRNKIHFESFSL
jgi:ferredoxin-NADP reductase